MALRALLTRAAPAAFTGGATLSRAAVQAAAPPLLRAALGASVKSATAGICTGKSATAGPVKADQGGAFGLSLVAGTRPKLPSLASAGRKICTSDVAASRLPAPKAGSRGTSWTTKAFGARFMSTNTKIPSSGGAPVRYVLAVCAVGGGMAVVLFYLSKPKHVDNVNDEELPASLDWSIVPGFPRVADPSYNYNDFCSCCWAVIAVKSVEARYAIEKGEALNLSIQQVIDCAAIEGCFGNNLNRAFKYISGAGLTTEEAYPGPPASDRSFWHGLFRGYCKMEGKPVVARIEGFQRINPTEAALMRALQTSPVAVYVNTTRSFEVYPGGVLEVCDLPPRSLVPGIKHVLLVVGYGKDSDGKLFWKLMNTWGPGWGEGGYVRFRRGCAIHMALQA